MNRRPGHHRLVLVPLLLLLARASSSPSTASGDFRCAEHDPFLSQNTGRGCLHRRTLFPEDYAECKDATKDTTCYLFLQSPPFIILNNAQAWSNSTRAMEDLQKPFRCGRFAEAFPQVGGLAGIAFSVHNKTSSADDLCMWGGHADDCKFNQLVDYTAIMASQGYRFAISGLLLELPSRQCTHEASAPYLDNSMIIIGKRAEGSLSSNPFRALTQPFHWGAWVIFVAIVVVFAVVCIAIAFRFRVLKGRSLVTAFFIFTGERDEAMAHEVALHHGDASHAISFATKYGLAMTLYRIALLAFLGIFVLFYEVAVVNFLFQQQSVTLTKSVTNLSIRELGYYSVLKDSALENVWNATVGAGRQDAWNDETIPWGRCPTATDCIRDAVNGDTKFVVTFEVVGKFLLLKESDCDELTIFETKDILYQFNAGWLYNNQTNDEKRKQVDREIVGLRIDGTTRQLIDQRISDFSCESSVKPYIDPLIVLIPCMLFVIPPLVVSILLLFLWKRAKPRPPPPQNQKSDAPSDMEAGRDSSSSIRVSEKSDSRNEMEVSGHVSSWSINTLTA